MNLNKFKMLVQREVWEHKAPLIWTPLIISALFIALSVFAYIAANNHLDNVQSSGIGFHLEDGRVSADELVEKVKNTPVEEREKPVAVWLAVMKAPFDLLLLFLLPFYCIAALFDERKDRSIYFWRSLPVSDTESLLAKLTTAIFIYPATMLVAAVALQITTLLLASIAAMKWNLPAWELIWRPSNYLFYIVNSYTDYVLMMLWSLPFLGLLMLTATAARRPFVWAILPWPLIVLVEKWVFDTQHIGSWIAQRVQGTFAIVFNDTAKLAGDEGIKLKGVADSFGDWPSLLSSGQFWFGIVLGVLLFVAALQVRRRIQDV